MHQGKPAGVSCIQLDAQLRCIIFGQPERPAVCGQLQASVEICWSVEDGGVHARAWLMRLEAIDAAIRDLVRHTNPCDIMPQQTANAQRQPLRGGL
jgi:hypothetical protein